MTMRETKAEAETETISLTLIELLTSAYALLRKGTGSNPMLGPMVVLIKIDSR